MLAKQDISPNQKKRKEKKRNKTNNQFNITQHLSQSWQLLSLFTKIIQSDVTLCSACAKSLFQEHLIL